MDCPAPNATSSLWAKQQAEVRNNSEIRIAKRLASIVCLLGEQKPVRAVVLFYQKNDTVV
jgi:hypothetical protein